MNRQKIFDLIQAKFDNIDMLEFINDLLNTIVLDIGIMNDLIEEKEYYELGNNNKIKYEDLESIVSIIETIKDIIDYNKR